MDVPRDPRKWIARGRALQIHQTSGCCPGGLRTINDDGGGCSDDKKQQNNRLRVELLDGVKRSKSHTKKLTPKRTRPAGIKGFV